MPFIFPSPQLVSWPCLTKKLRKNSTGTALSQVFGKKLFFYPDSCPLMLRDIRYFASSYELIVEMLCSVPPLIIRYSPLRRSDFYQQTKFIMSASRSKSFTNKYLNTYGHLLSVFFFSCVRHFELLCGKPLYTRSQTPVPHSWFPLLVTSIYLMLT